MTDRYTLVVGGRRPRLSWLRSKQPPMSKPSYYMTLERAWKNHVAPVWADREIWSIRRSEVHDWVSELATQKSRTVVLRALGVLAGILDVAIDDRRLANNPAPHVRNLPRSGPGKRRVYLSHDQVATLAACSAHPTMVLTLAYTGPALGRGDRTARAECEPAAGASSSRRTR